MGIILSALAAGGDQAIKSIDQNTLHAQQMERDQKMSDLAAEKAKTLALFQNNLQIDTANSQRQAASERIGAAQTGIIDSAINQKYADANDAAAGKTDAPLTPEQQAVIDQSKQGDRDRMGQDQSIRDRAAIQTGDIDPKTAATLHNKEEIQQLKSDMYRQSIEAKFAAAQNSNDVKLAIAQGRYDMLREFHANGGSGNKMPKDAELIDYLVKKSGLSQKEATDRVIGTGAGAMKDPAGMTISYASSLINSNLKVPKDAPPGTTLASYAMDIAIGQIKKAEDAFHSGNPAPPSPATPAAAPAAGGRKPFNPADFMPGAPAAEAKPAAARPAPPVAAAPPAVPSVPSVPIPIIASAQQSSGGYDASTDPVIVSLNKSLANLVRTDPANSQAFQALAKAKEQQMDKLRTRYGYDLKE